jgi:hypothetical protein
MRKSTNNPNGRPPGVPNKITAEVRSFLSDLISNNLDQLKKDFQSLEAKDRLIITERLLSYVIPKYSNIEIIEEKSQVSTKPTIIFIGDPGDDKIDFD